MPGLAVGSGPATVEDRGGDFAGLATDPGDVGRQAMHVEGPALAGQLHELFGAFPVAVARVVGQTALLELVEFLGRSAAQQGGTLFHDVIGGPALGIDHVGLAEGVGHAIHLGE